MNKLSDNEKELQEYFNTLSLKKLHSDKLHADDMYYNQGKPSGFTDWQYDMLKETLDRRDPGYVVPIGAKIRKGDNRVELPIWLGSMDKFKNNNVKEIKRWSSRNRSEKYIIEDKLDGVSCLMTHKNGKIKLYTRGDGIVGADISYLAKYFNTIPKNIHADISVRGELIMNKKVFIKKYSKSYSNPRNLVAGMIGAKTLKDAISNNDVQFIAYEMTDINHGFTPSEQLDNLENIGFSVVRHREIESVDVQNLMAILVEFVETSPFEIDGLIVQPDKTYTRNVKGNPTYAFAFKMRMKDNLVTVKVVKVAWGISKWSKLKPRIRIEPVKLGGVTINWATGFNARFILKNNIGPGAIVELTRSGDVIPYIVKVTKGADKPQMPSGKWEWNSTNVDIIATDGYNGESCIKLIHSFFKDMGFKNIGEKTIEKIYLGGANSILKILLVTVEDLLGLGFGPGESVIIYDSIHETLDNGMELPKMIAASCVFGQNIGEKIIKTLFDSHPDILDVYSEMTTEELYDLIISVPGFAETRTRTVIKNIGWAAKWVVAMSFFTKYKNEENDGRLRGYTFIISGKLSGYTKKEIYESIQAAGGEISDNVRKPTKDLIQIVVIVGEKTSKKSKDANKYGLKIYNQDELMTMIA
uniref:DNA ligase (NAD(+)) n=1 Tax=viral metagenome TaxID=1070528 RepID=A0A6C0LZ58_9ZZZZ